MILLKCPKCGRAADVPAGLADEGHRCYAYDLALEIADPAVARARIAARGGQARGLVAGAFVGAVGAAAVGALGGQVGFAIAAAIAGALLGAVWGLVVGLLGGVEWAVLLWDGSWLTHWAKFWMVVGAAGLLMGLSGGLTDDYGRLGVLGAAAVGGLCLGALLGAAVGKGRGGSAPPGAGPA